jgi:PTH2 family peptidyl-tRNA hydrolase
MDDYVMYFMVNNDLHMGKGKIAAQIGHATQALCERILISNGNSDAYDRYVRWNSVGAKKVVLKAKESDLRAFMDNSETVHVIDAGCTQIPAGSLTVIGFYPSCHNVTRMKSFRLL